MNGIIVFLKVILFIQIRSQRTCVNVRYGSLAAPFVNLTPMAASGGKAAIRPRVIYAKNGNLIARYHNPVLPLYSPLIPMPENGVLAYVDFAIRPSITH